MRFLAQILRPSFISSTAFGSGVSFAQAFMTFIKGYSTSRPHAFLAWRNIP